MMDQIQALMQNQLGKGCSDAVLELGVMNSGCLSLVASKLIGLMIILMSMVMKFPQILTLIEKGSAEGVNLSSILIETVSINVIVCFCYKNHQGFTTYGDAAFVLIQNVFLVLVILHYLKRPAQQACFVVSMLIFNYVLFNCFTFGLVAAILTGLFPFMIFGAFPQLWQNYQNKSCGNLSFSTTFIGFLCALGRVFTNKVEVDSKLANLGSALGALISTVLLFQFMIYSTSEVKPQVELDKKKQ